MKVVRILLAGLIVSKRIIRMGLLLLNQQLRIRKYFTYKTKAPLIIDKRGFFISSELN